MSEKLLSLNELRRMVKKHNELMDIKIPPKIKRDELIELIKKNGYYSTSYRKQSSEKEII